jgi:hypothetical protein
MTRSLTPSLTSHKRAGSTLRCARDGMSAAAGRPRTRTCMQSGWRSWDAEWLHLPFPPTSRTCSTSSRLSWRFLRHASARVRSSAER